MEVPLGLAFVLVIALAALYLTLHRFGASEFAQVVAVGAILVATVLIYLGVFHFGPLYKAPPQTQRGYHHGEAIQGAP